MRIRPHSLWPIVLGAPFGVLAAVLFRAAMELPFVGDTIVARHRLLEVPFLLAGVPNLLRAFSQTTAIIAGIVLLSGLGALLLRRYWTLWLLHKAYLLVYLLCLLYIVLVTRLTSIILEANVAIDGRTLTPKLLFDLRWHYLWPALCVVAGFGVLHLLSWRRRVYTVFTGVHDDTPATGDRVIENLLSNGRDPAFRKSMIFSIGAHVLVIIVLPWLLGLFGSVKNYRLPYGSGVPDVGGSAGGGTPVPIKVLKSARAAKPKKKYVINPHSAIAFHIPDLDESTVGKDIEAGSQLTYVADTSRATIGRGGGGPGGSGTGGGGGRGRGRGGKLGRGGGTTGGWPEGVENSQIRFIRLEYKGAGWDDGMDANSGADANFLAYFHDVTGFKVANNGESHPIRLLRKYSAGFAPPFVYMTGNGGIEVAPADVQILREYLTGGGLLMADAGSPSWDRSFRAFAQALFPGESLRVIADDDPLFQEPYPFANGAPPLWHHGGNRALGLKYKDRWCVFYHPGDMNDAWKTGHSGMKAELAEAAFEIGINVAYYAFTHYLELTAKSRK